MHKTYAGIDISFACKDIRSMPIAERMPQWPLVPPVMCVIPDIRSGSLIISEDSSKVGSIN